VPRGRDRHAHRVDEQRDGDAPGLPPEPVPGHRRDERAHLGLTEIDLAELSTRLGDVAILDVRSEAEYDGTGGSWCDPRQGHIPGARNLPVEELVALDEAELRERVGLPAGAEVVVYCHTGARSQTATQVLLSLGYEARNYVGSWHEWSRTELALET
jgi:3-mercaptopyruvate sulfurtransferase SseA